MIMQFKDPFLCKIVTFIGSDYVTFFKYNIQVTCLQLPLQFLDTICVHANGQPAYTTSNA